jgi:hypothetical protein
VVDISSFGSIAGTTLGKEESQIVKKLKVYSTVDKNKKFFFFSLNPPLFLRLFLVVLMPNALLNKLKGTVPRDGG